MSDNMPPIDLNAEKATIGSCLLGGEPTLDEVRMILEVTDFFAEKHRMIFETMIELQSKKIPFTDIVPVHKAVNGKLELFEILEIVNSVPSSNNASYYAAIVKEKSLARQQINYCKEAIKKLFDNEDPRIITSKLIFDGTNLLNNEKSADVVHVKDYINIVTDEIDKRRFNHGLVGVSSGFKALDEYTGGWRDGNMYIIGARPKMGKSTFALKLALNAAEKGNPVYFKSLEMTKEQLIEKIISERTGITGDKFLDSGLLDDKEWNQIMNESARISELPLYIDDKTGRASQFIVSLRRYKSTHKIKLAILDYIQRFKPENERKDKRGQVEEISNIVCDGAKEIRLPIIALAQLSRSVESREDKVPRSSDLKETGGLEADAAGSFLMYRDDYYYPEKYPEKDPSLVNFIVDLNRFGPTGIIDFKFHKANSRFYLAPSQGKK